MINNNMVGICGVRKNINGKLFSLVYGFPIALNTDPIEKKPLFHFLPGSSTYSLGTFGCNFACQNCQNWDISQAKNIADKEKNIEFIPPEKIVANAIEENCKSISYTYNEPTIFTEYALDIMKIAHDEGLSNVWVSNGFMSNNCLDIILPYLDAVNIDLKSFDENFYFKNCKAKLKPILDNLIRLKCEQVHLEITTLVIPKLSDDPEMLKRIADFIANKLEPEIPWHLSKFSPEISWKLRNIKSTDEERIYEAYEIGKQAGLKYVYVGNIPGDPRESTYCSSCGNLAIGRTGYIIERHDSDGYCAFCDKSLDLI
jgi:pyruvate formate lyase activating enzyme